MFIYFYKLMQDAVLNWNTEEGKQFINSVANRMEETLDKYAESDRYWNNYYKQYEGLAHALHTSVYAIDKVM